MKLKDAFEAMGYSVNYNFDYNAETAFKTFQKKKGELKSNPAALEELEKAHALLKSLFQKVPSHMSDEEKKTFFSNLGSLERGDLVAYLKAGKYVKNTQDLYNKVIFNLRDSQGTLNEARSKADLKAQADAEAQITASKKII